jgi:hypothetical protein
MIRDLLEMFLCFAARFVVALLGCVYLRSLILLIWCCCGEMFGACLAGFLYSPFILLMGPIAHDDEDPPNLLLPLLVAAAIVTAIWTIIVLVRRHRRARKEQATEQ